MNGNLWKIILTLIICNTLIIIISIVLSYVYKEIAIVNDIIIGTSAPALLSAMGMCIHQYVKTYDNKVKK